MSGVGEWFREGVRGAVPGAPPAREDVVARTDAAVVGAYARRAAAMNWDEAATRSLEQALDAHWDEGLVDLYGRLPVARLAHRRAQLERWLPAHPSSPALLLASARIAQAEGRWLQAEGMLHRAIAQGAGAPAWEALGDGAAHLGDEPGTPCSTCPAATCASRSATPQPSRSATSTGCRGCGGRSRRAPTMRT